MFMTSAIYIHVEEVDEKNRCLSCHSMDVGFLDPCTCFTITERPQ
jgi:hypothetical protein